MSKHTSIEGVRQETKRLLKTVPIRPDKTFEFIVQHPFTTSPVAYIPEGSMVDLRTKDGYDKWIKFIEEIIDSNDLVGIFARLNTPWSLTWLQFVKPHLSNKDFAELLAEAWVNQENPNMDANVSIATAIQWFKEADKKYLMSPEDYEYWENLPEEVVLYRGVSSGRKKYGISWTDNKAKAEWFQGRFATVDNKGSLLRVKVNKKHCLCYLNGRNEQEIVLDMNAVKKDIEEIR